MEKRVFTAFILSIVVALGYQYLVLGPKQEAKRKELEQFVESQNIEKDNEHGVAAVTGQPGTPASVPTANGIPGQEDLATQGEEIVLENNKLIAAFSTVGASLVSLTVKEEEQGDVLLFQNALFSHQPFYVDGLYEAGTVPVFAYRQTAPNQAVFTYQSGTIVQDKTITLADDSFQFDVSVSIRSTAPQPLLFSEGISFVLGSINKVVKDDKKEILEAAAFTSEGNGKAQRRKIGGKKKPNSIIGGENYVLWGSIKNRYYALIMKPSSPLRSMGFYETGTDSKNPVHIPYMNTGQVSMNTGETVKYDFLVYAGPQVLENLAPYESDFKEMMYFDGFFGPINEILIFSMKWLFGIVKSYGVAIIILTIAIKLLFYPFTKKSFKSMKQMQSLQPKIAVLKEKYKNDQQKLQQETMALYKKEKVNPLGGCLPMLVQLPIFFALFRTLSNAYELIHAKFFWIQSLSAPDHFMTLPIGDGFPLNILPLIMGVTMVVQQKMSTVDPQQQKMMMMMPVFFTFLLYNLPSGLVLYWTLSNVISIVQQKMIKAE
ncbi:MAG: membrane protein insertase YidC [Candidatus Auribacterota bacterium]